MRGSEISAVGVWGVSMSMRVRHGLRARGALVSTPLFEIQAAYRGPMGRSKNARSRSNGKLYLFARKPDHHWHRLGMGRVAGRLGGRLAATNASVRVMKDLLEAVG